MVSGGGATAGAGGAVAGGAGTVGGTTAVVTTPVTTVPAMMAMAPMLPAVALGIVKAIFISKLGVDKIESHHGILFLDEVIKAMKPKCYGYDCHHNDGYGGHGHHRRHINLKRPFPR